jgi:hypothetical protein
MPVPVYESIVAILTIMHAESISAVLDMTYSLSYQNLNIKLSDVRVFS